MQWKARLLSGEEVWENPSTSPSQLDQAQLNTFELVEDGMVKYRWTFNGVAGQLGYLRRTRIGLLPGGDTEIIHLVRFGNTVTYVHHDHAEISFDTSDFVTKP